MSEIHPLIAAIAPDVPELVAIRRDIHAHPELGLEEHRTAGIVAERLRATGLEPRTGVGRTGVTADAGAGPGEGERRPRRRRSSVHTARGSSPGAG